MIFSFKVGIYLFEQAILIKRSIFLVALYVGYNLVRWKIFMEQMKICELMSVINFLLIGTRMFLLLVQVFIFLKLDGCIDWKWKDVFWSYWILVIFLIGILIATFI